MLPHKDTSKYIGRHMQLAALLQNEIVEEALRKKNIFVELQ